MPSYTFSNKNTGETVEIFIPYEKLKDGYRGPNGDEDGWERVWEASSVFTETKNRVGK